MSTASQSASDPLVQVDAAVTEKKISASAAKNIEAWLTEPRYSDYAPEVAQEIAAGHWQQLDDVFLTVIPFGTGGRRGRMYPIGCNAINDRTIGGKRAGAGRLRQRAAPYRRHVFPARSLTTRAIAPVILQNCAPRFSSQTASRCISSTEYAARPSYRWRCVTFAAHAA